MSTKNAPPDDDAELFRAAMRDVRRLRAEKTVSVAPKPRAQARFTRADQAEVLRESLLPPEDLSILDSGEELSYRRPHISQRVLTKLRRGEYKVEAEFDLHGMTGAEARLALRHFLAESLQEGRRCVRIIHGKGRRSGPRGPVLKNVVNVCLRQYAAVAAFGSARPIDGGSGAVYVLLSS